MILNSKRSLKQTADKNNLETELNFPKIMLKVRNQKITTVRFLITAIKTKTTYTFFFFYIYARQHDFKLIQKLK